MWASARLPAPFHLTFSMIFFLLLLRTWQQFSRCFQVNIERKQWWKRCSCVVHPPQSTAAIVWNTVIHINWQNTSQLNSWRVESWQIMRREKQKTTCNKGPQLDSNQDARQPTRMRIVCWLTLLYACLFPSQQKTVLESKGTIIFFLVDVTLAAVIKCMSAVILKKTETLTLITFIVSRFHVIELS